MKCKKCGVTMTFENSSGHGFDIGLCEKCEWSGMGVRDIKFRCWCPTEKKYYYFEGIFNTRHYIERSMFPQYESIKDFVELKEPEQYTGLQDRDGDEIYEGDTIVANGGLHKEVFAVVFKDGAFCGYNEARPCKYTLLDVLIRSYDVVVTP